MGNDHGKIYPSYREKLWQYTVGRMSAQEKAFFKEHLVRCKLCKIILEDVKDHPPESAETLPMPGKVALPRGFRLIERIGIGGMGSVYKAHQASMDREVAIKILAPELAKKEEFVNRFLREAKAAAKLSHNGLVRVYDVGKTDDGRYYFVMEYIRGRTLRSIIKTRRKLLLHELVEYIIQVASALEHAWQEKIIHRDVKPENIMITDEEGMAKLTDLGLAKKTDDESAALTQTGIAMGTPDYMSPEQVRDTANITYLSDIYSLGATFFHCLTGRKPFTGKSAVRIMAEVMEGEWEWTAAEKKTVPRPVRKIVERMMALKPGNRFQTHAELIGVLSELRSTGVVRAPRRHLKRGKRPRRR
ncbi:MAG: serine/threonine protein kinase [Planctomycetota bacterium]|nr:MAG: serine/threonine protein kinase [Planctomycetota bacterium]